MGVVKLLISLTLLTRAGVNGKHLTRESEVPETMTHEARLVHWY